MQWNRLAFSYIMVPRSKGHYWSDNAGTVIKGKRTDAGIHFCDVLPPGIIKMIHPWDIGKETHHELTGSQWIEKGL